VNGQLQHPRQDRHWSESLARASACETPGFLGGGFPGLALPFVPGQEVVEAAGDGAGVQPGERVYASLFPAGGGVR
jgi:hypothetical protein